MKAIDMADADIESAEKYGHAIIGVSDKSYPKLAQRLNAISPVLFVSGSLNAIQEKSITIIGTREPSRDGVITAERITREFCIRGWTIVSGLALGIDSVAHNIALQQNQATIAVLAHGLDDLYPKSNTRLAQQIVEKNGALISEYPYRTKSLPANFVERDKVQAGLGKAVLMIQSDITGGSLHASRAALKFGRHLIIPYPTKRDIESKHIKINANLRILESLREDVAKYLHCSIEDTDKIIALRSRNDYNDVEQKILL